MKLRPVRRSARFAFWPLSRPLAAVLIWSHRHTIGLWARSYKTEVNAQTDGSFSLSRLRLLTTALWRVSSDPRFRNDPTVRRLTIDSELVEVDRDQRLASLEETLADLPGVVAAEIHGETDPGVDLVGAEASAADTAVSDRLTTPSR